MPELLRVSTLMNPRRVPDDDDGDHDCSIGQLVFSEPCQSGHIVTLGL